MTDSDELGRGPDLEQGHSQSAPSEYTFRLLYSSVAVRHLGRIEMGGLLQRSRLNNVRDAITGLLVHIHDPERNQAYFVQVLEGSQTAVERTYRRIVADEMHHTTRLLTSGPTPQRVYDGWSMMLHQLTSSHTTKMLTKPGVHPDLVVPSSAWLTDLTQVERLIRYLST